MIISKLKNDDLMLFACGADMKFRTMAQTRNFVGDWCEVATAAVSGAKRMKTDSRADICPDLIYRPAVYFESKAIGKTGSAIVYAHRADNDARFVASGNQLFYWLWNHGTRAGDMGTLYDLRNSLSGNVRSLAIVEFSHLHSILKAHPLKILNNKKATPAGAHLGYGTPTYKHGWSIRLSAIWEHLPATFADATCEVYGKPVKVPIVRAARADHFSFLHRERLFQ